MICPQIVCITKMNISVYHSSWTFGMLDKTKTSSRKDKLSVTLAWPTSRGWCPRGEDSRQLALSMVKTLLTTNQMALKKRPVTKGKTIWKVIFRDASYTVWWAAYGPPGGQTSTRFHSDVFFVVIIVLQVFLVISIVSFVIIIIFCYCVIINVTVTAIVMPFLCTRKDPVSSPGATFDKKSHNFERIEALRFLHWNIYSSSLEFNLKSKARTQLNFLTEWYLPQQGGSSKG